MAKKKNEDFSVQLTYRERLTAIGLLPEKGPMPTMRIARELRERFAVSAEEWKQANTTGLCETCGRGDQVTWDTDKEKKRTFKFDGFELKLLREKLRSLHKEEEFQEAHIPLWDKLEVQE